MPVEIPVDSFDPENLQGYDNPAPGKYHLEVTRVNEEGTSKKSGTPQMEVDFEILSGTPAGQEGKTTREYFTFSDKAFKRALIFACAVGLTNKEELTALKKAGKNPRIDFTAAEGRQLCAELVLDSSPEAKGRAKIEWNMWPVAAPEAKDIPKNQGKLNELGQPVNEAPFDGGAATDDPFA